MVRSFYYYFFTLGGIILSMKGMTYEELKDWVEEEGEASFRAQQIFSGLHRERVESLLDITPLPISLRERWNSLTSPPPTLIKELKGRDGTQKFLFGLEDGEQVETVFLPHENRKSLCISTQVGCAMQCGFCASATGLTRNLTTSEILEQVYTVERRLGISITHPLFMGMGEPLHNLKEILRVLKILNHPLGHDISMRRMVISSCGIIPGIYALAEEELPLVLAISLHASKNSLRSKIMPINKKYPLEDLLVACQDYSRKTRRRITFEYILLKGYNDTLEDALGLGALLKGINSHINLIPCNRSRRGFHPPSRETILNFYKVLKERGYSVTLRESRGQDILAACGQLKATDS